MPLSHFHGSASRKPTVMNRGETGVFWSRLNTSYGGTTVSLRCLRKCQGSAKEVPRFCQGQSRLCDGLPKVTLRRHRKRYGLTTDIVRRRRIYFGSSTVSMLTTVYLILNLVDFVALCICWGIGRVGFDFSRCLRVWRGRFRIRGTRPFTCSGFGWHCFCVGFDFSRFLRVWRGRFRFRGTRPFTCSALGWHCFYVCAVM